MAIRRDKELDTLVHATIAGGGVMHAVHSLDLDCLERSRVGKRRRRQQRNVCTIGDFVPSVVGLTPETLGPYRCRLGLSKFR